MDMRQSLARTLDLQLRNQAAALSIPLDGRLRSAAHLDDLFHSLVEAMQPSVFLELGAFEASASQRVKKNLPSTRTVAFEASPVNYRYHSSQVDYAQLGIEYLHCAVSDSVGTTSMTLNLDHAGASPRVIGSSSLLRHAGFDEVTHVEVPTTTVDAFLGNDAGRLAIWIDVEGATNLVLQGAVKSLERIDVLKVEVEDAQVWSGQWLAIDVIEHLMAAGLAPVARDVEYSNQYNIVFLSERALREPAVLELVTDHLYEVQHALRAEPSKIRQSESLRSVARPLRQALRRFRA